MARPTFCAVMANYNDAPTLEAALMPLIEQTIPFDRILVINDGSTDDSLQILEKLKARAANLEIIDNARNLGNMASTNIGFSHATEDYVFPASANDLFSNRLVEYAMKALEQIPDAGLIAGKLIRSSTETGKQQTFGLPFPEQGISRLTPQQYRMLMRSRPITACGGATFIHRQRALDMGGYREPMQWMADWFLFALLAARYDTAYVPEVYGTMFIRPGQFSGSINDWSKQQHVIRAFFDIMQKEYPGEYADFRASALLPSYDFQVLPLLLQNRYLTPLLLWRIALYKPMRACARALLPRSAFEAARAFMRV
jgi:glycosyltransferase involved in cell wall biosynthesis